MTTQLDRRRFLQAGLAAGVLAPVLSACNLDPAAKEAKNSVRFSSYGDPTKLGLRSKLADQYTSSHQNVKMVFEGTATAEYWDKLATQMAGGNAPDVINIDAPRIGQYGAAGALQSLQKYIPDTIDTKPIDHNLLVQGQLKGEQFGIPVAMSTYSIGYDVTVLDQLGLEHPKETWTWADFATLANQIRLKSGKKIYGAEDPSGEHGVVADLPARQGRGPVQGRRARVHRRLADRVVRVLGRAASDRRHDPGRHRGSVQVRRLADQPVGQEAGGARTYPDAQSQGWFPGPDQEHHRHHPAAAAHEGRQVRDFPGTEQLPVAERQEPATGRRQPRSSTGSPTARTPRRPYG